MKKVFPALIFFILAVVLVTGCDFFRTLAGRPTSSGIESKRELIRESLLKTAVAETPVQDTVQAVQQAVQPEGQPSGKPSETVREGKKRYYIVMASFSSAENASKYADRLSARGYKPEYLGFKGGYTAVGICGTDDEEEAKASLKDIKRQDFCPEGVWIIDRNKR